MLVVGYYSHDGRKDVVCRGRQFLLGRLHEIYLRYKPLHVQSRMYRILLLSASGISIVKIRISLMGVLRRT